MSDNAKRKKRIAFKLEHIESEGIRIEFDGDQGSMQDRELSAIATWIVGNVLGDAYLGEGEEDRDPGEILAYLGTLLIGAKKVFESRKPEGEVEP